MNTQTRLKKLEAGTKNRGSLSELSDDILQLFLIRNLRNIIALADVDDPDYESNLSELEWTESKIRYWARLNNQPDLEEGIESVMIRQTIPANWREPLVGKCLPYATPHGSPVSLGEHELVNSKGNSETNADPYDKMDDKQLTEELKELSEKSRKLDLLMRETYL